MLRNPTRWLAVAFEAVYIALGVVMVFTRQPIGAKIAGGAITLFVVVVAFRGSRSRIELSPDGVISADEMGRRRHLTWDQVDHFEYRTLRGIGAVVRSGRWTRLMGFSTLGDLSPEKATMMLEERRREFQGQIERELTE